MPVVILCQCILNSLVLAQGSLPRVLQKLKLGSDLFLHVCLYDSVWKIASGGQGRVFLLSCLEQGCKIKLGMVQYRVRFSVSQWHTPTQRFTDYPDYGIPLAFREHFLLVCNQLQHYRLKNSSKYGKIQALKTLNHGCHCLGFSCSPQTATPVS